MVVYSISTPVRGEIAAVVAPRGMCFITVYSNTPRICRGRMWVNPGVRTAVFMYHI